MTSLNNKIRYDPLYRIIDETELMRCIEGNYSKEFNRLKRINNLGIIPELIEMAKHSKYEHYSGTMFQICSLLKNMEISKESKCPLIVSALFLHLGHLPYTYSTERSLLLAGNLDKKVKNLIEKKVEKIFNELKFSEKEQKEHLNDLFSLKNYKLLYHYFSGFVLLDMWYRVEKCVKKNKKEISKEKTLKNIVDFKTHGFKLLEIADKADYVQRDALYFGTARIDILPKHLYRNLEKSPNSMDELNLIDSNLEYLNARFYQNQEVRWFTKLYEKILAYLIIQEKFNLKWLFEFDDAKMKKLITQGVIEKSKGRKKVGLNENWIEEMDKLFKKETKFSLLFEIPTISFKEMNAIDVEYKLLRKKKSKTGLLKYPFEKGILLDINYTKSSRLPPDYESFSISVFQNKEKGKVKFIDILNLLNELKKFCSVIDDEKIIMGISKQLSWTKSVRINNEPVIRAIVDTICKIQEKENKKVNKSKQIKNHLIDKLIEDLVQKKLFKDIIKNQDNGYFWFLMKQFLDSDKDDEQKFAYELLIRFLFAFPNLLQFKKSQEFMSIIYNCLLERYPKEPKDKRGHFFEALCLVKSLKENLIENKLIINGMIVIDPEKPKNKHDVNEFDIIELFTENNIAKCIIYACSIADDYKKNKLQLSELTESIHKSYPDLQIEAYYMIPSFNLEPKIVQTGLQFESE